MQTANLYLRAALQLMGTSKGWTPSDVQGQMAHYLRYSSPVEDWEEVRDFCLLFGLTQTQADIDRLNYYEYMIKCLKDGATPTKLGKLSAEYRKKHNDAIDAKK